MPAKKSLSKLTKVVGIPVPGPDGQRGNQPGQQTRQPRNGQIERVAFLGESEEWIAAALRGARRLLEQSKDSAKKSASSARKSGSSSESRRGKTRAGSMK